MSASIRSAALALVLAAISFVAAAAQDDTKKTADDKKESPAESKRVYRNVTPEKLETVLKDLNIEYKKVKGKEAGITFYDYEKGGFKIRLHNYKGKDLWIDAHFNEQLTLEQVNNWNVRAKFSRAVKLKGEKETVSLESQLDCLGGVSDGIIRQFVERFDGELTQFSKFLTK